MIDFTTHIKQIKIICQYHFVSEFSIFGSSVNGKTNEQSDVDVIVSFSDSLTLIDYADNFSSLKRKLEQVFEKDVDLVTKKSIKNPVLKSQIESSRVLLLESYYMKPRILNL